MKTETPSPLVPSLLFISVLFVVALAVIRPVTLRAPEPQPGPAGVVGGDEASLRLALARFLDLPGSTSPGRTKSELLIGTLPAGLDFVPPVPAGATVVGSLVVKEPYHVQIILDSSQPPDAFLAVFVDALKQQNFIHQGEEGIRLSIGSPNDTARYADLCRDSDDLFVTVGVETAPDGLTTATLHASHFPGSECPWREQRVDSDLVLALIPVLRHPPTARMSNAGFSSSTGADAASTSEGIGVKMTPNDLAEFYRTQLEAAGWASGTLSSGDYGAWSTWTLKDADGEPWAGSLIIVANPANDEKMITLYVDRQ